MDEERVSFAAYMFVGEAHEWWLLTSEREPNMTWERFQAVFDDKYFPKALKSKKLKEFIYLKQGSLNWRDMPRIWWTPRRRKQGNLKMV